jgi:hypothetical protein
MEAEKSVLTVLKAADYGLRPDEGGDASPAANRMLREASRMEGPVRILFEKGRYDFRPDRAFQRYCSISNNTNGLKSIAFPLFEAADIEIDGGGAAFVFHGIVNPFIIDHSRNIRLCNFSIDWERPFYTQARILDSDQERIDLEFDETFPHEVVGERLYFIGEGWRTNFLQSSIEFDPKIGGPAYMARDYYENSNNVRAQALDKRRVRLFGGFDGHKVGKALAPRPSYGTPRPGNVLVMKNDIAREAPGIVVKASTGVTVEDVTLHHACGMGFVAEKSRDLCLRRVSACIPERSGRVASLNADALHFVNCAGVVRVEACVSEYQLDDALNTHGNYAFVTGRVDDSALELGLMHHEQIGFDFCAPGDTVEFHHRHTLRTLGQAGVRWVEVINERYRRVGFDRPVKSLLDGSPAVVENVSWAPELTISGCRAVGNRGRGYLIKSRGRTTITGNILSTGGCGVLMEGKTSGYCESGPARDVLIEDNDFIDCKRGPWGRALIDIRPLPDQLDPGAPPYHRNIRIVGNRFRTFDPGIVAAFCVRDLVIEGNRIERTRTFPPKEESMRHSFVLRETENAVVRANEAHGSAAETPWLVDAVSRETLRVEDNRLGPMETDPRHLSGLDNCGEYFDQPLPSDWK